MLNLPHLKLFTGVFFALFILSACGGGDDAVATAGAGDSVADEIPDYPVPANLGDFQTTEYDKSTALSTVKAAYAYANISALTGANVKQGGEGQIVSVASDRGFNIAHQEFGTDGAAFDSVYDANLDETYTHSNTPAITDNTQYTFFAPKTGGGGNCSITLCRGTRYAALIAARKGDTYDKMHGIAYNAQLKAIITYVNESSLLKAIPAGVGANIIAMNHGWTDEIIYTCTDNSSTGKAYSRPKGNNLGVYIRANPSDPCTSATMKANNDTLTPAELTAWSDAVNPAGTNNTIMVFGIGASSFNSENGINVSNTPSIDVVGGDDPMAANIPSFRAAYPALYANDSLTAGRWLVVTALDANDIISTNSNGCGIAMNFCLAALGEGLDTPSPDGTVNNTYQTVSVVNLASSTVAGALAVLKGAFPNATPEQLTRLVLDTADYIPLDNALSGTQVAVDGKTEDEAYRTLITTANGRRRYINPVYGYGKLNLHAATTPSVVSSYVSASDNESIGALWADTKLTLSSHFGGNFESVKFGIGDVYGRHFVTNAPQTNYAPVAIGLDDYMANMLADNVQTQKIGGQAQANYSNTGEQSWMNLEYISGKATTKIAFQDSYKINPLSDTGTTTILRANNIRPASTNIGMMDVDYQLGNALVLSSYLARGEYDTGYKFDELGTDFDVNYKDSHLNIAIGNIREHGQFLGTNTSGAYALNAPSISRFTDVTYGHDIGAKFNIYANYINYETDVDMLYDQFATIDGLQADQYQIGFTGKDLISKDDSLNIALITKLGVTDGALNQNSTLGYTADGAFNNASQSYDLAVSNRHQQFEITYQGKLYQNADKISNFRDNRFFTSIRVDSNLNHVEGASQIEVISGINIRY